MFELLNAQTISCISGGKNYHKSGLPSAKNVKNTLKMVAFTPFIGGFTNILRNAYENKGVGTFALAKNLVSVCIVAGLYAKVEDYIDDYYAGNK